MANIPIPAVAPLWEHPGSEMRRLSTWKQQLDVMFNLTNRQLADDKKLSNGDKNNLMYAHLGAEAIRRFEHSPMMGQINTATADEFYLAISEMFEQTTPQAVAFYRLRTCRQQRDETATEFLSRLRTLQAECKYENFNADVDLAYTLAQNCYSPEVQKRLFSSPIVSFDAFTKIMQAVENAESSTAIVRGEKQVNAVREDQRRNRSPTRSKRTSSPARAMHNCRGCRSPRHAYLSDECKARGQKCNNCGRMGHFGKWCEQRHRGKSVSRFNESKDQNKSVRQIHMRSIVSSSSTAYQCTFHVTHPNGKDCYVNGIVDSGAEASLVPYGAFKKWINGRLEQSNAELYNFDGSRINGLRGQFTATVEYNNRRAKFPLLVLDTIKMATWGVDAIEALRLVIDGSTRLINAIQNNNIADAPKIAMTTDEHCVAVTVDEHCDNNTAIQVQAIKPLPKIVDELPQLVADGIGKFPDYEHRIILSQDALPVARAARPVPISRRAAVEAEIEQMVKDDIWEQVNGPSQWALNLVTVPKADGKIRITTDFSPLNKFVIPDRHPLPRIGDLYLQLQGATIFSKLDLAKGYFHIQLALESRSLTTTITPYGLYQYKRLPMGLTDAASVFQRLVSQTLLGCDGCISYLDDILIFGLTSNQHDNRLRVVLQRLADKDFRLNIAKCRFSVDNVPFLGHQISASGIKPDPSSLDAIRKAPIPKSITEVRSFLGSINYLREFLPHLADHAEPLQQLTRTSEQSKFEWNDQSTAAFEKLKLLLTNDLQLAIFDPDRPTILATDASNIGLGACLSQISRGRLIPIAFASKTLTNQERVYATNEREALGCVWACEHFANFLLGRRFTLITDHQSLVTILAQAGDGRKAHKFDRWRTRLSEFDYEIQHRPGADNVIPDMLSRLPQPETMAGVRSIQLGNFSLNNIAKEMVKDKVLQKVIKLVESNGWNPNHRKIVDLAPYYIVRKELAVEQSILWKTGRIVIPIGLRKSLLAKSHNGHPGIVRAKAKLRETYWWPRITSDIEETIRHCQGCQDSVKSNPKTNIPTDPLPLPTTPWEKIAIDVTGPFATTNYQNRFAIVVVDYLSGYPEVRLCPDHNVTTTIEFLTELFARYGNPSIIVSDNGPEYRSTAFEEFLLNRDILHYQTPVYHPQANGKVEVFNRSLKFHAQTLAASQTPFPMGITELLARYRAERPAPDILSPAEIMFNRRPRLAFEPRITEQEAARIKEPAKKKKPKGRHVHFKEEGALELDPINQRRAPLYKIGDKVRVKRPSTMIRKGQSPYSDVLTVVKVLGDYVFELSDGNTWSARRMRPYYPPVTINLPLNTAKPEIKHRRHSTRSTRGRPPRRYSPQ